MVKAVISQLIPLRRSSSVDLGFYFASRPQIRRNVGTTILPTLRGLSDLALLKYHRHRRSPLASVECLTKREIGTSANKTYSCFDVKQHGPIAYVTLNHPPLNLLDDEMANEFDVLTRELEIDASIKVVILQSGVPEFFIAHSGLRRLMSSKKSISATRSFRQTQMIGERIRNAPKVTIAKVTGRCRGGGNEIAMAADMCFAARGQAVFGQPEVGVGLVPGGGATQRLPRLMGRARALELLLTCRDFSAADAERMGFINRALPPDELDEFVDSLARDIARLPAHAITNIKRAVDDGAMSSMSEGLLVEARYGDECAASEATRQRVQLGLSQGLETVEGERDIGATIRGLPQ